MNAVTEMRVVVADVLSVAVSASYVFFLGNRMLDQLADGLTTRGPSVCSFVARSVSPPLLFFCDFLRFVLRFSDILNYFLPFLL